MRTARTLVIIVAASTANAFGAIATFEGLNPGSASNEVWVSAGTDAKFNTTVSVEVLTGFNLADVVIGSNEVPDLSFEFSPAWTAMLRVSGPAYDNGVYSQDVYVGGHTLGTSSVGTSLLLGTLTVTTDGLPDGDYIVGIDGDNDGSVLGLNAKTEVLTGFCVIHIPEPVTLWLLILGGLIAMRRRVSRSGLMIIPAVLGALLLSGTSARAVNIETVPVGNPGNAGELSGAGAGTGGHGPDRICGSVSYAYGIGKCEVTAGQYCEFLNAVAKTDTHGLYSASMWSSADGCKIQQAGSSGSHTYNVATDYANRPVNFVSWGDAARFANWLHNGQPTGNQDLSTTEDGSYHLNGKTSDGDLLSVTRKADATWAIPTEDEWYKAAYYDPNKPGGPGYWDYPTRSDMLPSNLLSPTGTNNANFKHNDTYTIGPPYYRTEIGVFAGSPSAYGSLDQAGNIFEWNDAVIDANRGMRGGAALSDERFLHAAYRLSTNPANEHVLFGFRVVCIPEPCSVVLLLAGSLMLIRHRRRKA